MFHFCVLLNCNLKKKQERRSNLAIMCVAARPVGVGGILCCVSGTVDRHVRLNSGRSMINTVAVTHNFPLSGDFCPLKWRSGPSWGGHIVREWYYGSTCSGKFWSLCNKYGGRDAHLSSTNSVIPGL